MYQEIWQHQTPMSTCTSQSPVAKWQHFLSTGLAVSRTGPHISVCICCCNYLCSHLDLESFCFNATGHGEGEETLGNDFLMVLH